MRLFADRAKIPIRWGILPIALAFLGCTDTDPERLTGTDPVVSLAKGGGGGGPLVDAADPSSAPQDVTLDVRVIGSGFDNGSVVKFLLAGQSAPKIVVNSSNFIDRTNLIANITIAADAEIALYDIEVTTSRGKKGNGSELFSVREKGEEDAPQFNVTSTELEGLDASTTVVRPRHISSAPSGMDIRVVGEVNPNTDGIGVIWNGVSDPQPLSVGPPPPIVFTPFEISSNGNIVGEAIDLNPSIRPIYWSSSQAQSIDLPQVPPGHAHGINNNGQIVGYSGGHATLWTVDGAGAVTSRDLHTEALGALGFLNSKAERINDRGQIAGNAWDGLRERAFLWDNGVVTILDDALGPDVWAFPQGINNADPVQVVGIAHDQSGWRRGFVWTVRPGGSVDMEELMPLPGPPSSQYSTADAINDRGEVAWNSDDHALLWTFDPETGARVVVDLGIGVAKSIDNFAPAGLTRVVGERRIVEGKGKKQTTRVIGLVWEVTPVP